MQMKCKKIFNCSFLIDFVCKIGENYYPLVFWEECKYIGDSFDDFDYSNDFGGQYPIYKIRWVSFTCVA